MRTYRLRSRREELGVTALQMAQAIGCSVQTVLNAEFGVELPKGEDLRDRLARAYQLTPREYIELALDAAEAFSRSETARR
jgi:transcriptional regulator with XRE-family HTH domain